MANPALLDVQNGLIRASRAMELFQLSLTIFQANCQRGDFIAAEAERIKMQAALDSYLDEFWGANMAMQRAER